MANTNFPPLLAILETIPVMGNERTYAEACGYYSGTEEAWDLELANAIKLGFVSAEHADQHCAMCNGVCRDVSAPASSTGDHTVYEVTEKGHQEYCRLMQEYK